MQPLIGVSTSFREVGDYRGEGYQRPIAMAGALPVPEQDAPRGSAITGL